MCAQHRWNFTGPGFVLVIAGVALLSFGTIRKKDDPVVNTQTDPILWKTKEQQIQEGEKGAPTPSFQHYAKSGFLSELPVNQESDFQPEPLNYNEDGLPWEERGSEGAEEEYQGESWWYDDLDENSGDDASVKETSELNESENAASDSWYQN